jgi:hypothetical protein
MPDLEDDKIAKLLAERGVDTKRILALINGWFGTEAGPVQEDSAGGRMDKNCVDNAHKADWIREMNAMEHDCDEVRKDNRFNLTGWPYEVEEPAADMVNHPAHYTHGKYEVIEIAEDWFPTDPLLFQALQYMGRCQHKGQLVQDLEKTIWMIQRRIDNFKRDGK